jgi:hypothetical protein
MHGSDGSTDMPLAASTQKLATRVAPVNIVVAPARVSSIRTRE